MKKLQALIAMCITCACLGVFSACANSTESPYIGDNGNWWIGDTDTGVQAQGDSVSVLGVTKILSLNGKDTYAITFSDGTSSTFTVTNGKDGDENCYELCGFEQ